jgi:hypothetical protein
MSAFFSATLAVSSASVPLRNSWCHRCKVRGLIAYFLQVARSPKVTHSRMALALSLRFQCRSPLVDIALCFRHSPHQHPSKIRIAQGAE